MSAASGHEVSKNKTTVRQRVSYDNVDIAPRPSLAKIKGNTARTDEIRK